MSQPVARHTDQGARAWSLVLLEWVRHAAPTRCLDRALSHDRCVAARKCSIQAVRCWARSSGVSVSCVLLLPFEPDLNVSCWSCIHKEKSVPQIGIDHLVPKEMADRRNHRRSGKRKCQYNVFDQHAQLFSLSDAQSSTYRRGDGWIGVDGGLIPVQGEQVGFFCRLRKRLFGMDDVPPPALSADLTCSFLTLGTPESGLPRGEGDFMNFYLTCRFPDDEIWSVGVWCSL